MQRKRYIAVAVIGTATLICMFFGLDDHSPHRSIWHYATFGLLLLSAVLSYNRSDKAMPETLQKLFPNRFHQNTEQ